MRIPRTQVTEKDEIKKEDIDKYGVRDSDLADMYDVVACPWKNYDAVTTKVCIECPFFLGFAPENYEEDVTPDNMQLACAHPIGRRITHLNIKG